MKNKILVIDDDKNILMNIVTLLKETGYQVFSADDGADGFKIAQDINPDMVICDIMMPDMDGYKVFEEFKKDETLKSVPFIFLTAKAEKSAVRDGMMLGADDYIVKPFKSLELLKSIEARFNRIESFKEITGKRVEGRYMPNDKILVKINGRPNFIVVGQILYITAERQYTTIKQINGKTFVLRRTIGNWEQVLPEDKFLRIHRAVIVNIDQIEKTEACSNSRFNLFLKNNPKPFTVSKRYAAKLRKNPFPAG